MHNAIRDQIEKNLSKHSVNRARKFAVDVFVTVFRLMFLISIGYIILFPILSATTSAIKTEAARFDVTLYWLPRDVTFEHFKSAFKVLELPDTFIKTISLNLVAAFIEVISCAVTAYGFARFKFKLSKLLQGLLLLSIIIPMQFYVVSIVVNYKHLDFVGVLGLFRALTGIDLRPNILNTNLTFYLPSIFGVGLRSGILIYIYIQFFAGLPKELEEAAWIDGAGPLKTFIRIAVPSSTVVILVVTVFSMIWHYNDYYLSIMFFNNDYPLAVQLSNVQQILTSTSEYASLSGATRNSIIMASCLIFVIPMLIFYLCVQHKFVQSIDRIGITG